MSAIRAAETFLSIVGCGAVGFALGSATGALLAWGVAT